MTQIGKIAFKILSFCIFLQVFLLVGCDWSKTQRRPILDGSPDPIVDVPKEAEVEDILWGQDDEDIGADTLGLSSVFQTLVDAQATGYGTFQSHNQKTVSNKNGLFMTHIRSRNEAFTAQQWRLSRSRDGGKTFQTVYEETSATSPPALETDENGNLYLMRGDFSNHRAYFYKFSPADNYSNPITTQISVPGGTSKSTMLYDRDRKHFYYFARNQFGTTSVFYTLSPDGVVLSSFQMTREGIAAALEYPHLSLDENGVLYAAWTTQKDLGCCQPGSIMHNYVYWDIHFVKSLDGGETWQKMNGTQLALPIISDDSGPADRIILNDEYGSQNWLESFKVRDGQAHFLYLSQDPSLVSNHSRQHYVRVNVMTGVKEKDFYNFKGEEFAAWNLDGCFVSSNVNDGPLYVVTADAQKRLVVLGSDDGGATWYDYARSEPLVLPYAIGCARDLSEDGMIFGSYTSIIYGPGDWIHHPPVYAFRLRAGRAGAVVVQSDYQDGVATVSFGDVHGQPTDVRFSGSDGVWGPWSPFSSQMVFAAAEAPVAFQLKSRLNVISRAYSFP